VGRHGAQSLFERRGFLLFVEQPESLAQPCFPLARLGQDRLSSLSPSWARNAATNASLICAATSSFNPMVMI
jgi:hypothetical protein